MSQIYTTANGFVSLSNIADIATVLKKCPNPKPDIEESELDQIHFNPNAKRLPSNLWSAIVKLYFHFAKEMNTEVRVELYKHLTTNEWKVGVPKQEVSVAICTNHDGTNVVDILTGERFNPESDEFGAWYQFGTSHSHGKLTLSTFSGTDDAEELKKEGPHILVSCIDLNKNTYVITGSIVWNGQRKYVDYKQLIDFESNEDADFHPNCLEQVTRVKYTSLNKSYGLGFGLYNKQNKNKYNSYLNISSNKSKKLEKSNSNYFDWNYGYWDDEYAFEMNTDPFFVSDNISCNKKEKAFEVSVITQQIEDQLLSDDLLMKALVEKKITIEQLRDAYEEALRTLEYFSESDMYKNYFV